MGAGAAGCGPFGIVFTLIVIGLVIQYWWVILTVLGVIAGIVAMIVALVKIGRRPSAEVTQQPQEPPRPLVPVPVPVREAEPKAKPKPKAKPLDADELAEQMRALKHTSHVRAMQEWDYEWILLAYPNKSSREINEIANAHFAKGRSIGVNYGDPIVPGFNARKPGKDVP